MRLCDRVIVREWVQNKNHHHVYESRTFSKGLTWCKLMITPIRRELTESGNHLIFGHSPQTLTTGVIKMLHPRNTEHIGYQLRCDNNVRTSNASIKERYWRINSMHVGIKFLDQQWRHVIGMSHSDSQPQLWMTSGRSVSTKSAKMTRRSEWTPRWEKFSEKSFRASLSWNRIEKG